MRFDLAGPLHLPSMLGWLRTRAIPGLEFVTDTSYTRTLRLARGAAVCSLTVDGAAVIAELFLEHESDLQEATHIAQRLFDVGAPMVHIDALLRRDHSVAKLVDARPGMRIPGLPSLTESATRAILGQQITVVQARNQVETLVHELGDRLPDELTAEYPELTLLFPRASTLATDAGALIRGPNSRKETLARTADLIAMDGITDTVDLMPEELIERLQTVKGIGPWTAGYVALRLLGAPDVFLVGDVAMMGGGRALGLGETRAEAVASADSFAPYRSYLMLHLWQYSSERRG